MIVVRLGGNTSKIIILQLRLGRNHHLKGCKKLQFLTVPRRTREDALIISIGQPSECFLNPASDQLAGLVSGTDVSRDCYSRCGCRSDFLLH